MKKATRNGEKDLYMYENRTSVYDFQHEFAPQTRQQPAVTAQDVSLQKVLKKKYYDSEGVKREAF